MNQPDPFIPSIAWCGGFANPEREPVEVDVQDGRAEYLLSGPYHLTEGASIEVKRGKVIYCSGKHKPS